MRKLEERAIVVASHNCGKVREINALMAPLGFVGKSAADLGLPEPPETGTTFKENAAIKALSATRGTGMPALADDSGLCVDALGGAPGVYTADWAETATGERDFLMAMKKVNDRLAKTESAQRTARFVAVLCLAWPDEHVEFFRGEIEGEVVWPPRGDKGFGYDPIFLPEGHDRTFGEMSADEKHNWDVTSEESGLSHRARAFERFVRQCLEQQA